MHNITIREAHKWASSFLSESNIDNSNLEAEVMLSSLYGWDRAKLFANLSEVVSEEKLILLKEWLTRRSNHEPLQYIVGSQDFYGRTFTVSPSVLIPRPETELLVETIIKEANQLLQDKESIDIVDIGTGSGAIAITLALEKTGWNVTTVDISQEALIVAKGNAERLEANLVFYQGSLLEPLIANNQKVDIIVSNPPYIPSKDIESLMFEVRDYEPILALDGGIDGLDFYREIITQSKEVLRKPGLIGFEIGIYQANDISQLLKVSGAAAVKLIDDFQGIPRIALGYYK